MSHHPLLLMSPLFELCISESTRASAEDIAAVCCTTAQFWAMKSEHMIDEQPIHGVAAVDALPFVYMSLDCRPRATRAGRESAWPAGHTDLKDLRDATAMPLQDPSVLTARYQDAVMHGCPSRIHLEPQCMLSPGDRACFFMLRTSAKRSVQTLSRRKPLSEGDSSMSRSSHCNQVVMKVSHQRATACIALWRRPVTIARQNCDRTPRFHNHTILQYAFACCRRSLADARAPFLCHGHVAL